ncbi:MAG: alanine--tRNA ligase [Candidatus Staskawiczbacteria bacterium]|nr:alanine--tRNA ligase [Candidatus Staskawiczbacteria bacterium]
MNSAELRQKYLAFFAKNGHTIVPSASLIPDKTDGTALFTTAGMQPLVPYLLGEKHPGGKRIVGIQKCFRTVDIDEVGDDTHLTFFEMLGNWSLGDYWKKESIIWSFEFLTKELSIPLERLAVSCFTGDENAPKDEESAGIWEGLGVKKERIAFLPKEDNWWGPVGETGPCGPDTEIFYWKSTTIPVPEKYEPTDKNWVEIWNNVFMQYVKTADGKYVLAEQKNVDTGMGFERTLAILNGFESVYETDLFVPIMKVFPADFDEKKKRIIADHIRAITFLVADGVLPSNKDQGYVLRRLMRTIASYTYADIEKPVEVVISQFEKYYPNLSKERVILEFQKEQKGYEVAYQRAEREIIIEYRDKQRPLPGAEAFGISSTIGIRLPDIDQIISDTGTSLSHNFREEFDSSFKRHQELSRTASAGMFKGGLADHEPATIKLHTAHHLLLSALQELFGRQVKQRGSNITSERLRIDFSFDRKITDEEKKKLEEIVNEKIQQGLDVVKKEMPLGEAEKIGAEMEFGVKYGNTVSVYFIEDKNGNAISKEFCGGPHVQNTSELGKFKIIKEEASSQGVRRIKAILE